jgi:hypothetical protein
VSKHLIHGYEKFNRLWHRLPVNMAHCVMLSQPAMMQYAMFSQPAGVA